MSAAGKPAACFTELIAHQPTAAIGGQSVKFRKLAVMKRLLLLAFYSLLIPEAHAAGEALRTPLNNCRTLDRALWSHPTHSVIERAEVEINRIELCNGDLLPVFTVSFKYDPRAITNSFFIPSYQEMLKANGYWPFIFVDLADSVSIEVERSLLNKGELTVTYGPIIKP